MANGYIVTLEEMEKFLTVLNSSSLESWINDNAKQRSLNTWIYKGNVCTKKTLKKHYEFEIRKK